MEKWIRVVLISDTHQLHNKVSEDLDTGDIIIHAGDFMNSGYSKTEAEQFFKWYELRPFDTRVFISGNHDRIMQNEPEMMRGLLTGYTDIEYLEDEELVIEEDGVPPIKIYGSPWQPEFFDWAYNLPRNGSELQEKWDAIPEDTDILITHGPAWGFVDQVHGKTAHLGCELLTQRINQIKPKIHVCGHIHSGYGHYFDGHTHFFNASVLNERYQYTQLPWIFDWNPITNEITFVS
jgi:predicted phosphodiesterase